MKESASNGTKDIRQFMMEFRLKEEKRITQCKLPKSDRFHSLCGLIDFN